MKFFMFVWLTGVLLLSGCQSFYAVSLAKGERGGVFKLNETNGTVHGAVLPGTMYLIRRGELFYAALNRLPQKKDKIGGVAVLKENSGGRWETLQIVSAEAVTPCHLAVSPDGGFLYTANYSSGDISEFRLKDGLIQSAPRRIIHTGKGVTKRQKSAHPHFVGFSPTEKQLFVCDLGTDEVVVYNYSAEKGVSLPAVEKLKLPPGAGPRHLAFSPDGKAFYTANELNSTASSFVKRQGRWKLVKTLSTLEKGTQTRNSPGAIKITSDGKFFIITNRGHDSLALFETAGEGDFCLIGAFASPGRFPCDVLLLDGEKRLAASHLKSGTVDLFSFDRKNKKISAEQKSFNIPQAIGLCE